MEPSEMFNLQWDGFMANARVAFKELREKEEFCDVILVAGDGKQIHAHKVILSQGSSFLQKILRENPHPHPLIYLKGMRSEHLVSLLDFVYTGEANLVNEDLNEFMDIAEELKVNGLTKNDSLVKIYEKQSKERPSIHSTISPPSLSHPHSEISSPQDPVAVKKHCSSTRVSHRHGEKSPLEGPVYVEEVDPLLKVLYPERVMSAPHQGQLPTEKCSSNPHNVTSSLNKSYPRSTCEKDHDDTCNVKAEIGEVDHCSINYETNDHSEEYIRDDSRRISDKNGRPVIVAERKHNNQRDFTEEIKEEAMSDNEQSVHDWYERGEEVMDSVLLSEQSIHNWSDNNMISNGEQDLNEKVLLLGKENFQCSFCTKTFGNVSNLNRHKKIHNGEKFYQCLVCEKTFTQKSTLKSHERIHTGVKPYQCLVCSKMFSHLKTLKDHRRVHTGERPYQCSLCSKTFIQSSHLKRHMKMKNKCSV